MKDLEIFENLRSDEEGFDFKKWLHRVARAWYWFAGCLFVCLLTAWLYLKYTTPVYQAVASVMIKDERKGGDMSDNAFLKELGLGSSKLVENEIEILKSYDLMEDVVTQGQFFIYFSDKGRIRDVPLFKKEAPLLIEILNPDSLVISHDWMMKIQNDNVVISRDTARFECRMNGQEYFWNNIRFRLMPNEDYIRIYQRGKRNFTTSCAVLLRPINSVTRELNAKLVIAAATKQSSVVSLTINDPHLERARSILAMLIEIYNNQGLSDKNRVTANTIDFLNERLKAVASDLQGVEGQVQNFKTQNQITDISSDAQQYMQVARDIDMQKAESQTRLNIVSALERDLIINQDNPGLVPSTLGIEETSLASLVEKHNTLVLERDRAQNNPEIGPQNPWLVDLKEQVQETRRKLLSNVRNLKEAYKITLNDIFRKDEQLRSRLRNVPQMEQKLVEIQRNRNVEEQLYAFLLQKREEAAVTLASNIPDSRIIVKPRGLGSVSPKSKMIWLAAFAAGLLIPVLVMVVGDIFNNKVGDVGEVEKKSKLPLLGQVSHIRKMKSSIVITEKSRSAVAEQIRTLRTAIGFSGRDKEVRRVLVTSSQPGDGKSFISINLAASYALLNKKTVIVELDMRRPHVAKYLGITPQQGISSVITGKAGLNDVLVEVPGYDQFLYLLPAGYLPPNPAEMISGSKMSALMLELQEKFDYVIIDTPPFGLVTDAILLQEYADVSLVVLRQGHTHRDAYSNIQQRLAQRTGHPTYIVLNGVGWKRRYQRGYGYGNYSQYGYGYGKGYFEEES